MTGGGWINSPAGAYVADPTLVGQGELRLRRQVPEGREDAERQTEFQFQAGNLNFHSTVYEWLVVAGAKAQFKGTGTINGAGGYGFLLTVTDGQLTGGGGTDKFRIKIWNMATGAVVYDNAAGVRRRGRLRHAGDRGRQHRHPQDQVTADGKPVYGGGSVVALPSPFLGSLPNVLPA